MQPPALRTDALYDWTGRHLCEVYPPLMVNGVLTEAHAEYVATRPVARLFAWEAICPDPHATLALVWMMPPGDNPLTIAPGVFPYLVNVIDQGCSVMLHATSQAAIDQIAACVNPMLGGGHA